MVTQLVSGRASMERAIAEYRFRKVGKHLELDRKEISWVSP